GPRRGSSGPSRCHGPTLGCAPGGGSRLAVCSRASRRACLDAEARILACRAVVSLSGLAPPRLAIGGDPGPVPDAEHLRRRSHSRARLTSVGANRHPVEDIAIEEATIESIIRRIYEDGIT